MASVRKRGNSYQVTVSNGRRADGSQIIETDTYTPEPGMTPKQIERALEQFKVDFERDVKSGQNVLSGKLIAAPNCKLKQTFWNQPLLKQSHCLLVIQHDI